MADTAADAFCYLTTTGRRTGRPHCIAPSVFAKYAPRYRGDLTDWRNRVLPIAIDQAP